MAAVLACGPRAVLSHRSAGALWGVRRERGRRPDVSSRGAAESGPALRVHRPRSLSPDEVTTRHAHPRDHARPHRPRPRRDAAAPRDLERLLDQVEIEALTDYPALRAIAAAHPGHNGAAGCDTTLDHLEAGTALTKSDLERLFLKICRDHGLPTPLVNQYVDQDQVDFLFPAQRLIVEADSWKYHRTRDRFERDRRRDAAHTLAGYRTLRFTDRDLERARQHHRADRRAALVEQRAA